MLRDLIAEYPKESFDYNKHDVFASHNVFGNTLPIDISGCKMYNPIDMNVMNNSHSFEAALAGLNLSVKYFFSYFDSKGKCVIDKQALVVVPCCYPACTIETCFPAKWCDEHMEKIFHVEVVQSNQLEAGLALRFTSDILKGSVVAQYNGVIVDKEAIQKKFFCDSIKSIAPYASEHSVRNRNNGTGYLYEDCHENDPLHKFLYVDTTFIRDVGSFLNEPRDGDNPNCEFLFNGITNVLEIIANRNCRKHEEATLGRKKTYTHNQFQCITFGYEVTDYPLNSDWNSEFLGKRRRKDLVSTESL